MDVWIHEVDTGPLPRGGVGDANQSEIEQKEMNLGDHTIQQARFSHKPRTARRSEELKTEKKSMNQIDLDAVIRSVEDQPNDRGEMSNAAMSSKVLDIASCGVETTEGDPIRFNALARDMQQPALASQRSCAS